MYNDVYSIVSNYHCLQKFNMISYYQYHIDSMILWHGSRNQQQKVKTEETSNKRECYTIYSEEGKTIFALSNHLHPDQGPINFNLEETQFDIDNYAMYHLCNAWSLFVSETVGFTKVTVCKTLGIAKVDRIRIVKVMIFL